MRARQNARHLVLQSARLAADEGGGGRFSTRRRTYARRPGYGPGGGIRFEGGLGRLLFNRRHRGSAGDIFFRHRPWLVAQRYRRADDDYAGRQRTPTQYGPAKPAGLRLNGRGHRIFRHGQRYDIAAIGALAEMFEHFSALAFTQRFLGKRGQQIGVGMHPGPSGRSQTLLRDFWKLFHLTLFFHLLS